MSLVFFRRWNFLLLLVSLCTFVRAENSAPAQTQNAAASSAETKKIEPSTPAVGVTTPNAAANTSATPAGQTNPAAPAKPLREQLIERFTKRDGNPASVVVFNAMETSSSKLGAEISKAIEAAMKSYGRINVRREDYALPSMTMEEIRFAMARYQSDILITPVVKENAVDLFLFDRRSPYELYEHSEEIPAALQKVDPADSAREITHLLVRRLLFRFLNHQYFELPREESLPVLQAEIPKWVSSEESLSLVNRELTARFYLSATLGAALDLVRSGQLWNSNLVGAQFGFRLMDRLFLEAQFSAFSYNAMVGSLRYTFLNRESPFRLSLGLGFGVVTRDKVWNQDQTIGLGRYSYYFVPGASLLFPVGDIYIKLEAQMFVGTGFNQFIWTFMPGIQFHF